MSGGNFYQSTQTTWQYRRDREWRESNQERKRERERQIERGRNETNGVLGHDAALGRVQPELMGRILL